jgi:putative ABC transport system ATP-binding protein
MMIEAEPSSKTRAAVGKPIVALAAVDKRYPTPAGEHPALSGIDLEIDPGQFVAVVGKSGSGKSTLLHLIGGLDRPSRGAVVVAGTAIERLAESPLARWRGRTVGVVFQFFQLLPTLTTIENVLLPMDFLGARPARQRRARALELLDAVGIADQAAKLPAALSGGQQQRAAIARALANDPPLLVADEPTGNLDSTTSGAVFDLLAALARAGTTVVVATHERDIARWADRVVGLVDGRIAAGNAAEPAG